MMRLTILAAVFAFTLVACHHRDAGEEALSGGFINNSAVSIWPDSILLPSGVAVVAGNDSTVQIRVEGNLLRTISTVPLAESPGVTFHSSVPILNSIVRLERAQQLSEQLARSPLVPLWLYLNPMEHKLGCGLLQQRVRNNLIVPSDTRRFTWPVINDNGIWMLAATEMFRGSGNLRWLDFAMTVGETTLKNDCAWNRCAISGLFYGVPRYMALLSDALPQWMQAPELYLCQSLMTNVAWCAALRNIDNIAVELSHRNEQMPRYSFPIDADTLARTIMREMWMPNIGVFSALAYGIPTSPLQLHSSDNLAQAVGIMGGVFPAEASRSVMEHTPFDLAGIGVFTPHLFSQSFSEMAQRAVQTVWGCAAAAIGDAPAVEASLGALMNMTANSLLDGGTQFYEGGAYDFPRPVTTLLLRAVAGLRFHANGLEFSPCVPAAMEGDLVFDNISYRRSRLKVTIHGTGCGIERFLIDGKEQKPMIPPSLQGVHHVEIFMNDSNDRSFSLTEDSGMQLPKAPTVEWQTQRSAVILLPKKQQVLPTSMIVGKEKPMAVATSYSLLLYLNGAVTDNVIDHNYTLADVKQPTVVQFVTVEDNHLLSFSSRPHLYVPPGQQKLINLASYAPGGTRVIADRRQAARFVEQDSHRNRIIRMPVSIQEGGRYLVDVHYLSGLGIVNADRRTAIRSLRIDGRECGAFLFPQNAAPPAGRGSATGSWQQITSFSNPLLVELDAGNHILELCYLQPSPVFISPTANVLLADYLRIIHW